ncbi:MAG: thioredoxin-disulfide reductase [candidate division WOR-3 bacterium]|nr:thioredoxin-disulfide reductase [candidate division WOR-3 bacterium]
MKQTEILVVGGGPAGLTAGIYAARSGHRTLVLEKSFAGGQMALTSEVENYPGFSEPVSGMLLAQTMEQQAIRFGCEVLNAEATGIKSGPTGFEVATTAGPVAAAAVIVCTGVKPKLLGVPGEKELSGRGVSYCAVCDGPLFKGREVAVIGGGDSALDEALYLSNIASRVHLIHRRDEFRACPFVQQRLRERENVTYHLSCVVESINGTERVEGLTVKNLKDAPTFVLPVGGAFIYVGWLPNTGWCSSLVALDDSGNVKADDRLRTTAPGVFAAGDVRNTPLRQVATAVGDGALAAMSAHDFLIGETLAT